MKSFHRPTSYEALGRKRATNGRGFVYLWIILYNFGLFLRLVILQIQQLTSYSLTCLFNPLSQIGGRVLWEHQVAGSNPVAPTISKPSHTSELPRLAFLLQKFDHSNCGQIVVKCCLNCQDKLRRTKQKNSHSLKSQCCTRAVKCFGSTRSQVRILSPRSVMAVSLS